MSLIKQLEPFLSVCMKNFYKVLIMVPILFLFIFIIGCQSNNIRIENKMKNVESGLQSAISINGKSAQKYNILDRMKYFNIPGVSIAVINNYEIEWAKG